MVKEVVTRSDLTGQRPGGLNGASQPPQDLAVTPGAPMTDLARPTGPATGMTIHTSELRVTDTARTTVAAAPTGSRRMIEVQATSGRASLDTVAQASTSGTPPSASDRPGEGGTVSQPPAREDERRVEPAAGGPPIIEPPRGREVRTPGEGPRRYDPRELATGPGSEVRNAFRNTVGPIDPRTARGAIIPLTQEEVAEWVRREVFPSPVPLAVRMNSDNDELAQDRREFNPRTVEAFLEGSGVAKAQAHGFLGALGRDITPDETERADIYVQGMTDVARAASVEELSEAAEAFKAGNLPLSRVIQAHQAGYDATMAASLTSPVDKGPTHLEAFLGHLNLPVTRANLAVAQSIAQALPQPHRHEFRQTQAAAAQLERAHTSDQLRVAYQEAQTRQGFAVVVGPLDPETRDRARSSVHDSDVRVELHRFLEGIQPLGHSERTFMSILLSAGYEGPRPHLSAAEQRQRVAAYRETLTASALEIARNLNLPVSVVRGHMRRRQRRRGV